MNCSSSLVDDPKPLVLDTSVLINMHTCSYGPQILTAIPNKVTVPDIVIGELAHETSRINGEHYFLQDLLARQVVRSLSLDDAGWRIFGTLTTAAPSLGDGEAATIAIAATTAHLPIIDDAKGRKSTKTLIDSCTAFWSLDLFLHPSVQEELGSDRYVEAIYLALRDGRMRIDEDRCDAIVELIGIERALQCPSLPGFKTRRVHWKRIKSR